MSAPRAPLPRRAKSHVHTRKGGMTLKRILEDNVADSDYLKQISAMRLVNDALSGNISLMNDELIRRNDEKDTLSGNINLLNDEIIKKNDEIKSKDRFILKKIKYTNEVLKSNKILKDKLSENDKIIADLNQDLKVANERIKSMELTIETNRHPRNINGKVKGGTVVEFKRNSISYILTNDDPEGCTFIDMMVKKCKLILDEYPKDFYIKTLDGNKQFVFGSLEETREVDINTICIICKNKFRDTNHGKIIRVPYGVTLMNTKTTIVVGAFCGHHKWGEDGQVTPLNFMTKPDTFDCIL